MIRHLGRILWVVPGGRMPLASTGREPEFTSHDKLSILNASGEKAQIEITIYYTSREPAGPYRISVQGRRCRHVRVNDLIDPEAIPLDMDYSLVVRSDTPVIVQFSQLNSGQAADAVLGHVAFPVDKPKQQE